MSKKKSTRSGKDKKYYERQFFVTVKNKARKAAKRLKKATSPKALERKAKRIEREAQRKASLKTKPQSETK